jgi:hypothetical protein
LSEQASFRDRRREAWTNGSARVGAGCDTKEWHMIPYIAYSALKKLKNILEKVAHFGGKFVF